MARRPVGILCSLLLVAAAGCEVGSLGGPGGDDQTGDDDPADVDARPLMPSYRLSVAPATAETELGTEVTYTIAVDATDFDGPVALVAAGAPASWTVTITPATVNVRDGGTVTAEMTVVIPPNGEAAATGQALAVNATAAPGGQSAATSITVANQYTFPIASGTGTGAHWGAMSGGLLRLRAGATLRIPNNDTIGHRIHAGGGAIDHQGSTMAPGQAYSVTVQDGSDTFYCHDHGQGAGEVNLNAQ
jgi:plastocyanin